MKMWIFGIPWSGGLGDYAIYRMILELRSFIAQIHIILSLFAQQGNESDLPGSNIISSCQSTRRKKKAL